MVNYDINACGGDVSVNETTGYLESPNYPRNYTADTNCIWRLIAPENEQISLKFLEDPNLETGTVYDYVAIQNGLTEDSPLIGNYSGKKLPPEVRYVGNKLYVTFHSDLSSELKGFRAVYSISKYCLYSQSVR
ncbi:hypothetical protein V9T40_010022 [Parthenolecanium corni]|uniref:CUB domain-containing protein n=1 Tax=Parthenolecanium corni TaxID=536013 RepID=A0AAN9TNQ9_9HEMI